MRRLVQLCTIYLIRAPPLSSLLHRRATGKPEARKRMGTLRYVASGVRPGPAPARGVRGARTLPASRATRRIQAGRRPRRRSSDPAARAPVERAEDTALPGCVEEDGEKRGGDDDMWAIFASAM
uniref:Uncharacterized protein n=1 Tax=Oryza meridionalis TaxID=40149 RepID=A0A0E0DDL7_9ORYZ